MQSNKKIINQIDMKLHQAVKAGELKEVEALLEDKKANPNALDQNKETPLHHAARSDNDDMINLLLDRGALCDKTNWLNEKPIHIAALSGSIEALSAILKRHPEQLKSEGQHNQTAFFYAALEGNLKMLEILLQKGDDINQINPELGSALHVAARENNPDMVKFLVKHGAKIDIVFERATPLVCIAKSCPKSLKAAEELIKHHAETDSLLKSLEQQVQAKTLRPDQFDLYQLLKKECQSKKPEQSQLRY